MTRGYGPTGSRDKKKKGGGGGGEWSHKLDKGKLCHKPGQAHEARQGAVGPANKPTFTTKGRGKWLTLLTEGRGREWLQNTGKRGGGRSDGLID